MPGSSDAATGPQGIWAARINADTANRQRLEASVWPFTDSQDVGLRPFAEVLTPSKLVYGELPPLGASL